MNDLIIGSTGLIRTTITQLLAERGDTVMLYNRGQSHYPTPPGVRTLSGDRTVYTGFARDMTDAGNFAASSTW